MNNFDFISALLSKSNYDNTRVNEAILAFVNGDINRFLTIMQYITGVIDKPVLAESITIEEEDVRNLISYDFFNNKVEYTHINFTKRKVSAEVAAEYNGELFDDFYSIPENWRRSNGDTEIRIAYMSTDTCSIDTWLKYSK